ncbi:beta-N-acetylhexosaminidase [Pedobacter sp. ASV28]|uniref:beta-N-acetylhexosaminidase n=1 Tax=Pedobacter sp. ASV28 TaxID=2795123 RepID=UPI0018ECCC0E|nr:beta-N-acetylhexosaminidase [Pedobacter sp. ASV28]
MRNSILVHLLFAGLYVFFPLFSKSQKPNKINIIPKPLFLRAEEGEAFRLTPNTPLVYNNGAYQKAKFFARFLQKSTGYKLPLLHSNAPLQKGINLFIQANPAELNKEAYELSISSKRILLTAIDTAGLFNGFQSIVQLLPPSIGSEKTIKQTYWPLPAVTIKDAPRFSWRGYMQDVSRTFYKVEVLKKYIDVMALYKLNTFHLHLTDDQGWRIEIKKYPELTSKKTTVFVGKQEQPSERSGYYTQEQLKDLISYAAQRNITIVPEIDVPGHSWPIIITHPELGVNQKTTPDYVFPFVDSWGYWGFQFTPNPLDPSKEAVYTFLNDIFNEIADLFPSPYIHFGGDEVVHRLWENEPHIQAFMKEKGFTKVTELQSYFVGRVCEMIRKKGKKPIGWNDILEGADNLTKETAIMSWLGGKAIQQAASKGFYTVATPTAPLYFDITQDDRNDGTMSDLAYGNINSIDKIYNFDPTASLQPQEEAYVLGIQANMWPAIPQEVKDINVQNFPRLLALAEIAWATNKHKDFAEFTQRLTTHYPRLDALKIDYFKKGGYIAGTWKPNQIDTGFRSIEWDVTQKVYANGRIIAGFFYTNGTSFLKIKNVSLLEDGKVISKDDHIGLADKFRGTHKTKTFLYHLKVDQYKYKSKYTLSAEVSGEKSTDSYGNLTFNLSPYEPFKVTEATKK